MLDKFNSNKNELYDVNDLLDIMAILRGKNGCKWDKEQNHPTIRNNVIEEAYEVADAIDNEDMHGLQEELGDLLLQIVFHSQMACEYGNFNFDDVCNSICRKLIYRHPHVFGDVSVKNSEQILENWDKLKLKEKSQDLYESFKAVPKSMPSLARAQKLLNRASKIDSSYENLSDSLYKAKNNIKNMQEQTDIAKNIGQTLLNLVNVARLNGLDIEQILYNTNEEFITNFGKD